MRRANPSRSHFCLSLSMIGLDNFLNLSLTSFLSPMNPFVPFFLRPLAILKFYEESKEDQKEHITWRTSMSMKTTSQMELFHLVHAHLRIPLNSIVISNLATQ
jgi:type IV secretory pathway ATPase VirB11/archaellum biosynthesis ATPase